MVIAFPDLTKLAGFIERFGLAAEVTAQMMKVLKIKGLTNETHDECQQLLTKLMPNSKTKVRLQRGWYL